MPSAVSIHSAEVILPQSIQRHDRPLIEPFLTGRIPINEFLDAVSLRYNMQFSVLSLSRSFYFNFLLTPRSPRGPSHPLTSTSLFLAQERERVLLRRHLDKDSDGTVRDRAKPSMLPLRRSTAAAAPETPRVHPPAPPPARRRCAGGEGGHRAGPQVDYAEFLDKFEHPCDPFDKVVRPRQVSPLPAPARPHGKPALCVAAAAAAAATRDAGSP